MPIAVRRENVPNFEKRVSMSAGDVGQRIEVRHGWKFVCCEAEWMKLWFTRTKSSLGGKISKKIKQSEKRKIKKNQQQ